MRATAEIGLKITARTREYYRYTDVSAEFERRGAGSSRPHLAWAVRSVQPPEKVFTEDRPGDRRHPTNHL